MEQTEQTEQIEYGIAGVEKTLKEITTKLLNISYEIYSKIQKKEDITPDLLEEQKMLEKQQAVFTKAIANMKRATGGGNSSSLAGLHEAIHRIESSLPNIKQSLNNES